VDVCVGKAGHDRVPTQVDDVRGRESCLVDPDAACHDVTRDRERARGRKLRVERADEPVFETHSPNLLTRDQQQHHAGGGEQRRRECEHEHAGGDCHGPVIGRDGFTLEPS
jgi:hypothetical protein